MKQQISKIIKGQTAERWRHLLCNTMRLFTFFVAISVASCDKESLSNVEPNSQNSYIVIMPEMIETHTRASEAGMPSETWFNNLGIYYFENDKCVATDTWTNTGNAPFTTFPIKRAIPAGLVGKNLTIYVATSTEDVLPSVNVDDDVSQLLDGANNIYKKGYAHNEQLIYPTVSQSNAGICIPMSAKITHTFPNDGKVATVNLKRSVAKLRIIVSNAMPTIGVYDETRMAIRIENALQNTPIIPYSSAAALFVDYPWVGNNEPPQEIKDEPSYKWYPNGFQKEKAESPWLHYCYINPNNYANTDPDSHITRLKLFLPYRFEGDANFTDCTYEVSLNRAIEPNYIYQLEIKVYGLGIPTRSGNSSMSGNAPYIETSWSVKAWDN